MNTSCKLLILIAIFIPTLAQAGPVQEIELTDGSIVRAEVVALNNGTYTLRSDSLGEMEIAAAKIKTISNRVGSTAAVNPDPSSAVNIEDLRKSIINDPNAMAKIETLQNDPLVQDILNDEATMRALSAGDLNTLMNDPKIKALMEHSTVRDITQSGGL